MTSASETIGANQLSFETTTDLDKTRLDKQSMMLEKMRKKGTIKRISERKSQLGAHSNQPDGHQGVQKMIDRIEAQGNKMIAKNPYSDSEDSSGDAK